jgi:hypothetical protein
VRACVLHRLRWGPSVSPSHVVSLATAERLLSDGRTSRDAPGCNLTLAPNPSPLEAGRPRCLPCLAFGEGTGGVDAWVRQPATLCGWVTLCDPSQVWQPGRAAQAGASGGRRGMKRGILAYRAAHPDLRFTVLATAVAPPAPAAADPLAADPLAAIEAAPATLATEKWVAVGHQAISTPETEQQQQQHNHQEPRLEGRLNGDLGTSTLQKTGDNRCGSAPGDLLSLRERNAESARGSVVSDGAVFVHWRAEGTQSGSIRGSPPTNTRVSFSGLSRLDFDAQGRIVRSHVYR